MKNNRFTYTLATTNSGLFHMSNQNQYELQVKAHQIPKLYHERIQAKTKYPYATSEPESFPANDFCREFTLLVRNTKRGSQPQPWDPEATRVNLLTREGIAFLKRAEDEVINHPEYKRCVRDSEPVNCYGRKLECALPGSITNHPFLYGTAGNVSGTFCRLTTSALVPENMFNLFIEGLKNGTEINRFYARFMGVDINTTSMSTQVLRSFISFGSQDENATDAKEEKARFDKWASDRYKAVDELSNDVYHSYIVSGHRSSAIFAPTIQRDQIFAIGSVVLVFIVIWLHTTSSFLACTAMAQIVLAFPLTYLIYRGVFQVSYFAVLQTISRCSYCSV